MADDRLIYADKLKRHYSWWGDSEERKDFDDIVDSQPTVEAKPVVYGEWEEHRYGTTLDPSCVEYSCSVCGKFVDDYMPNFCPNCGAEMRGEK